MIGSLFWMGIQNNKLKAGFVVKYEANSINKMSFLIQILFKFYNYF